MEKGNFKKKILNNLNEKNLTILFIFFCVFCAFGWALIAPDFWGPDESMKMDICKYIADYGKLPHGGDEKILNPEWGISYGFTPILSYIVGGIFIKITSIFTQNMHYYYFAARLVSVLCYAIFLIFTVKIAEKIFNKKIYKWLFIYIIGLMPQVMFIGAYINNDSLALMCISMIIYSWIIGIENKWTYKNCIYLAISLGLCALSYYNAYGYILTSAILFLITELKNNTKFKDILKRGLLIGTIAFLICGWWFIRSAIIYDGDFLGLRITDEYSNKYAVDELKAKNRKTPLNQGQSLIYMLINRHWITYTLKSFYGLIGKMNIEMKFYIYYIIWFVWGIQFLGYVLKKIIYKINKKTDDIKIPKIIEIMFIINMFITLGLSLYYSYASDFQPQGRYIMPMLIPFIFMMVSGLEYLLNKFVKKEKYIKIILGILITGYFIIFSNYMLYLLFLYMPMYL